MKLNFVLTVGRIYGLRREPILQPASPAYFSKGRQVL